MRETKVFLPEGELPWFSYNILADLPNPSQAYVERALESVPRGRGGS